jgi:hypothetical protein
MAKPPEEANPKEDPEFVATLKRMLETPPTPHKKPAPRKPPDREEGG